MKSSRILTCSAIVAMGSMLAWGARPTTAPHSTVSPAAAQGRMMSTPDQSADAAIARAKQAGLSDADATAAKAPLVTYYTGVAKARADAGQGNRPDADTMTKLRTDLSSDLTKAGVSADGVTKITAALAGRGRRGGGGGGGI